MGQELKRLIRWTINASPLQSHAQCTVMCILQPQYICGLLLTSPSPFGVLSEHGAPLQEREPMLGRNIPIVTQANPPKVT